MVAAKSCLSWEYGRCFILFISYLEPSFLTLDEKGCLRLHYVKEKTEQVIEPEEVFRSGIFGSREYEMTSNSDIFIEWEIYLCHK